MSSRGLLLVLVFTPLLAWGQIRGVDLYPRGQYEKAIRALREEVDNTQRSDKERALARAYLAASFYASGKVEEAQEQLKELARLHPEHKVDPRRFPADFIQFAAVARESVEAERRRAQEQAERERLRAEQAERERLEAEQAEQRRREREAALQAAQRPSVEVGGETEPEAHASTFRLRPELTGYSDVAGLISGGEATLGAGLGLTLGGGPLEGTVRALAGGTRWAWELEIGYLFGTGIFQPRLAARSTLFPRVGERPADDPQGSRSRFGFGGTVGARLALSRKVTLLADVGGEFIPGVTPRYSNRVFVLSAGIGYNLF